MSDWKPIARDMGAWRPVEYEIGEDGQRTGRTRTRQFAHDYAKAARSGVWPVMATREKWAVDFK